jgi:hypothetical protein
LKISCEADQYYCVGREGLAKRHFEIMHFGWQNSFIRASGISCFKRWLHAYNLAQRC